jgi:hypothetical protein
LDALAVELVRDLGEGHAFEQLEHAADDVGFLGDDHECPRLDHGSQFVALGPEAEGVVSAVASLLEGPAHHGLHPLRVEIALQLSCRAKLGEHEAPVRAVKREARERRDEQADLVGLQLVLRR